MIFASTESIGAVCIAPVILAKVLGSYHVTLTLGESGDIIKEVEKTGAVHEACPVTDYITDRENKVITTPAYMFDDAKPHELFKGISGMAKELMEMA
jgi:enhancing lycopene biosynthesis protein 2